MAFIAKRPGLRAAAALAIACTASAGVQAGPEDAFNLVAGTSITYDDNLFRLSSNSAVPVAGKSSRSDYLYTAFAGVRFDKTYSLQRFQVDLTTTRYEYQEYDFLSFTAVDYRAAWLWSLTPRLTGIVYADRVELPTNFSDFTGRSRRNIQTTEVRRAMADWAAGGAWHLIGGVIQTRLDNSGGFTEVGNYVQDSVEAGVRYVTAADNSLALVQRESRGDYSGRTLGDGSLLDTGYDQSETELRGHWKITGHSSFDARIGYLDRQHEHYGQRDFSGTVGRLAYLWEPTGKLQFTLATGRDLYSYQNDASSYYVYDYVSFVPAWLISSKTTLRLKLDYGKRDFRGPVQPTVEQREDTVRAAQLNLLWQPQPSIDVSAHVTREERDSNIDNLSFHGNIAGLSLTLRF
ncbi:MAG TPA: XrtB/PEP-CTERM-associated polysaccharide biosynthesis outer membrane protein EpsL [Azonexus sp.]